MDILEHIKESINNVIYPNKKNNDELQNTFFINYIKKNAPHLLIKSKDNDFLHKLVVLTKKHKILNEYLKLYLQTEKGKSELNSKTSQSYTPLMITCRTDYSTLETIQILIDAKADVNIQDINGNTALILAILHHNNMTNLQEMVLQLIKANININIKNNTGHTALMYACGESIYINCFRVAELLIESGADLDLQNENGLTALSIVCNHSNYGSSEIAKLLIRSNANLDLQDKYGKTVLIKYCMKYNTNIEYNTDIEIIELLIANKANLDLQDSNGKTALMYACKSNLLSIIKLLIKNKANLDLQDSNGKTALMYACIYGLLNIVKILIENNANLDLQDSDNNTALMHILHVSKTKFMNNTLLCNTIHEKIVDLLLQSNVNLKLKNKNNFTTLMLLSQKYYIKYYIEYYKNENSNELIDYIKKNNILVFNYDLLVSSNIIPHVLGHIYKNSKHNKNIIIPQRIFEKYEIIQSECFICIEDKKTFICNYGHTTCNDCLNKVQYKCLGCQQYL